MDLLKGLSLFSGIGGIDISLQDYIKPVAYCEIEPYCQSLLLQRMQEGNLPEAPIWPDVRTIPFEQLPSIDIIYGGFPCQDISVAGTGKGLAGERSGLFFEIVRLAKEIKPPFIFLENVPAITTRGGLQVVREIDEMGYDCRWCVISAASVGALHRRERWFLLAYSKHYGQFTRETRRGSREFTISGKESQLQKKSLGSIERTSCLSGNVANTQIQRLQRQWQKSKRNEEKFSEFACNSDERILCNSHSFSSIEIDQRTFCESTEWESRRRPSRQYWPFESREHWQEVVSDVCRVTDGVPNGVDRLKSLGNSVVPQQVLKAFEILLGINNE